MFSAPRRRAVGSATRGAAPGRTVPAVDGAQEGRDGGDGTQQRVGRLRTQGQALTIR
jgi:hypothetical protein